VEARPVGNGEGRWPRNTHRWAVVSLARSPSSPEDRPGSAARSSRSSSRAPLPSFPWDQGSWRGDGGGCAKAGSEAGFLRGDMADEAFCLEVVNRTVAAHGTVDYLVKNAFSFTAGARLHQRGSDAQQDGRPAACWRGRGDRRHVEHLCPHCPTSRWTYTRQLADRALGSVPSASSGAVTGRARSGRASSGAGPRPPRRPPLIPRWSIAHAFATPTQPSSTAFRSSEGPERPTSGSPRQAKARA